VVVAFATHPDAPAGRTYRYSKNLLYWAIVVYKPT
jgi:hypothetical protein